VYSVYAARPDALGPLRKYFPDPAGDIGFVGEEDPETALWRPFGSRRVRDLTPPNLNELLGTRVRTVVASAEAAQEIFQCPFEQWLADNHLRVIGREKLTVKVTRGPQDWFVMAVEPSRGGAPFSR
jgi:hypothetical protein